MRVLLLYQFFKWFTLATNSEKLLIEEMNLKNYSLISNLTSGNECTVFLFQNTQDQTDFVVNKLANPGDLIGIKEIENEKNIFEILASIPDYKDYVIGYYGSKIVDSATILEIEYAPEKNLADYLKSSQGLTNCDYAQLGLNFLEAVHFLHSNGIAHLGLYPRNIFVKNINGKIKPLIGDFGKSLDYYAYLLGLDKNLVPITKKKIVNQETKTILHLLFYIFMDTQLSNYFLKFHNHLLQLEVNPELANVTDFLLKTYKTHFITGTCNQCEILSGLSIC
jgi:serine/threonine protein kinase